MVDYSCPFLSYDVVSQEDYLCISEGRIGNSCKQDDHSICPFYKKYAESQLEEKLEE